jgi:hypothetical protein
MKIFIATGGYLFRTINGRTVYLHTEIAEVILGKPLPPEAEIHHINGDPADNHPENLVICPNHEYHMILHQRQRALKSCGNANWRPCHLCGIFDDPEAMRPHYKQFYHRHCMAQASRERRAKTKETSWKARP